MSFHALILQVSRRVSSFILVPAQYYLVTNMPCHKGIKRLGLKKKKKIKMKKKKRATDLDGATFHPKQD